MAYASLLERIKRRVASLTSLGYAATMRFLIGIHRVLGRTTWIAKSINICCDPQITHLRMLAEVYVQCVQEPLKIRNGIRNIFVVAETHRPVDI